MTALLDIKDLSVGLIKDNKKIKLVDRLSLSILSGETLGLVGESGCGKSITASAILRLLPKPFFSIDSGQVFFESEDLLNYSLNDFNKKIRLNKISMIFQESAFNPVLTIGNQFQDLLLKLNKNKSLAKDLLNECGLSDFERIWKSYPHQLSGGMKQRIAIAFALIGEPKLLIADEPTTSSDATVQLQILNLLKSLQKKHKMAILFISHDLNVVKFLCDRVDVMYCGRIIERADVNSIMKSPEHPYTAALLASNIINKKPLTKLATISGSVPTVENWHQGCAFYNRCKYRLAKCKEIVPELNGRHACFNPLKSAIN